jgi:N-acetylglucosamine kinase-like BadF-type ATPase
MICDKNERTPLLEAAESYFEVDNFRKAIDIVYSADTAKDYIAGFAAKVGELASNGCKASKEIITSEAKAYAQTVITLINELESCPVLSLYGGVFQHNPMFRAEFEAEIAKAFPATKTEILDMPPEEGALKAARELK